MGGHNILHLIRKWRDHTQIQKHREHLERNCNIGAELNSAPWQKKTAILKFHVSNRSGDNERIQIGNYCNLSCTIDCNVRGRVIIGNHVFMNSANYIRCDYKVSIGNFCMFGPNVRLWDTNNHPMSASARERQAQEIYRNNIDSYESGGGPITIEENVWLCVDVIVLADVTIGYGSVIGAGSVVTHDIPPMTFAAGIPAKFISHIPN